MSAGSDAAFSRSGVSSTPSFASRIASQISRMRARISHLVVVSQIPHGKRIAALEALDGLAETDPDRSVAPASPCLLHPAIDKHVEWRRDLGIRIDEDLRPHPGPGELRGFAGEDRRLHHEEAGQEGRGARERSRSDVTEHMPAAVARHDRMAGLRAAVVADNDSIRRSGDQGVHRKSLALVSEIGPDHHGCAARSHVGLQISGAPAAIDARPATLASVRVR
jgi:hypothetical protein